MYMKKYFQEIVLRMFLFQLFKIFALRFLSIRCDCGNPLHRIEFGPSKFFSKSCKCSIIFYSTLQFSGGGHFRKACRSRKKESKQLEITCKQSDPARTISQIQKRREFVRLLCYEQCPKNSFKRLYIVKGLLLLGEKTSFSKEFRGEFQCGGEGKDSCEILEGFRGISHSDSFQNSFWDSHGCFDEQRLFSVNFERFRNFFDFDQFGEILKPPLFPHASTTICSRPNSRAPPLCPNLDGNFCPTLAAHSKPLPFWELA